VTLDTGPSKLLRLELSDTRVYAPEIQGRLKQLSFFFFFTLVTGPRRSLSLKLSDSISLKYQPASLPQVSVKDWLRATNVCVRKGDMLWRLQLSGTKVYTAATLSV
jgi:hypothetical protein